MYEKKENWTNTGRISSRRLVCIPTIQHIIINLHTKYDYSFLQGSTDTFDEKLIIQSMERKKIGQILGRISSRRLVCNPTIQHVINLHNKNDYCSLQGSTEIFDQKYVKKENWTNTGRISCRRLVHNPTIQYIIKI